MAGIYIHIPFCKQACHYCNFHFSTSLRYKNDFLAALLNEISLRKNEWQEQRIDTIYFGGGTPGLLSVSEVTAILSAIRSQYRCEEVLETTIEMNPDDVNAAKIEDFKAIGIDRVSLGVQSFFEEDLLYMNRSHTSQKAQESIRIIASSFTNYSVDLIYGYPLLSDEKLASNVSDLLQLQVPHISIYGMTVEPKTALDTFIKKGEEKPLSSMQGARQFEYLMHRLTQEDYEHYEISSYGKKSFRAIHNSNYWSGMEYVGFGPGAHSFNGEHRSWNIANNALYIKSLDKNELNQEQEKLSSNDILNELILLGLRVKEGIELEEYKQKSTPKQYDILLENAAIHIKNKLLEQTVSHLRLTQQGRVFCDGISADLFV